MGTSKGRRGDNKLSLSQLVIVGKKVFDNLKNGGDRSVVTDFFEEWNKVMGQIQAVKKLSKNLELPKDVEKNIAKIESETRKSFEFVQNQYGVNEGGRAWSWSEYIPIAKPAITTLGPAACFYVAMDKFFLAYIFGAFLIFFLLLLINKPVVEEFINAWRGTHDAELEKYIKKFKKFYATLRDYVTLQNQLRKARTFDVRSILGDDEKARGFWIRHFGASTHSVDTPQMIDALLHHNNQHHIVGKQSRDVIYNTISNIIDKNGDGLVSPIELLDFLQYFGPVDVCVERIKDSLVDVRKDGSRLHPWFIWRSKDRNELEQSFFRYASEGHFVVRCSSRPGCFAVTSMTYDEDKKLAPKHALIYYEANTKPSPVDGIVRPFYWVMKNENKVERRAFTSIARLVASQRDKLKEAFMDPETPVYFSISGQKFHVQASMFMQMEDAVRETKLGKYFDPRAQGEFPRGKFWNSQTGHSPKEPIFLDRDPEAFNVILNWYRYGKLYIPEGVSKVLMEQEIKYFGLPIDCVYKKEGGFTDIEFHTRR